MDSIYYIPFRNRDLLVVRNESLVLRDVQSLCTRIYPMHYFSSSIFNPPKFPRRNSVFRARVAFSSLSLDTIRTNPARLLRKNLIVLVPYINQPLPQMWFPRAPLLFFCPNNVLSCNRLAPRRRLWRRYVLSRFTSIYLISFHLVVGQIPYAPLPRT